MRMPCVVKRGLRKIAHNEASGLTYQVRNSAGRAISTQKGLSLAVAYIRKEVSVYKPSWQ